MRVSELLAAFARDTPGYGGQARIVVEPDGRRRPYPVAPVDLGPEGEGPFRDPRPLPYRVCEVVRMWAEGLLTPGTMPPGDPFEGEGLPEVVSWNRRRAVRAGRRR